MITEDQINVVKSLPYMQLTNPPEGIPQELTKLLIKFPLTDFRVIHWCITNLKPELYAKLVDNLKMAGYLGSA